MADAGCIHKSFVAVIEDGMEAATATSVIIELPSDSALQPPGQTADQPFSFPIGDGVTDAILFVGRVVELDELAR